MKKVWKTIVLVFVLLFLGSVPFFAGTVPFLFEAKSGTEMPNADEPVVKVEEAEQPATAQEIQDRNEKLLRYYASRHGSGIVTKDRVDMTKPIRNISGGRGKTKTVVRIRYEDGSASQFTVDNK